MRIGASANSLWKVLISGDLRSTAGTRSLRGSCGACGLESRKQQRLTSHSKRGTDPLIALTGRRRSHGSPGQRAAQKFTFRVHQKSQRERGLGDFDDGQTSCGVDCDGSTRRTKSHDRERSLDSKWPCRPRSRAISGPRRSSGRG